MRLFSRTAPLLTAAAVVGFGLAQPAPAKADDGRLTATYSISIAGINVGRADAESRFRGAGYTLAIRGFTSGVSRIVSDAEALMASSGRITGDRVVPANFTLETSENGQTATVRINMRGRSIVNFSAVPELADREDRVPIRASHKRDVVDPLSAFIVAMDRGGQVQGPAACNRSVQVFDGWQRYDVRLSFARMSSVTGESGSYSGAVIICAARYVPVAGHRPNQDSVQYMANNKNIEVWLMPVEGRRILIPYQISIGTQVGNLVVRQVHFENQPASGRAATVVQ